MIAQGKRLAFDYGDKRIGVAIADADGLLAVPLTTLNNDQSLNEHLFELFADYAPVMVYVGLPGHLSGLEGESATKARAFARFIASEFEIPVHLVDERFSTQTAHTQLRKSGQKPSRRRDIIDQIAATNILETALNYEKMNGAYAGESISL